MKISKIPLSVAFAEIVWNWKIVWKYSGKMETKTKTGGYEMSITIALAGNPNCGKTTLFNGLTGANQFVGNWPGVTVEKKEGKLKEHKDVFITDLPGIYSFPRTPWKKS